ncbi:MAG: amidohydrolase family protein [Kiritimatiellae bacterium]|nr:amidohydrolase family protein [Kiritimatiellia bacterium]
MDEMKDGQREHSVIDAHVHVYTDAIADRVTESLGERFGNPPAFTASVGGCRDFSDGSGVTVSLNLPVATTLDQVEKINAWALDVNREADAESAGRPCVRSLASYHPDVPDAQTFVDAIARVGFAGVKLHAEYQTFTLEDKRMEGFWEAMSDRGLVVYFHAGGERVFQPPFRTHPRDFLKLHRRFPKLRMVLAHLGGFGMWDEAEAVLCGEEIALDLAHVFGWTEDERILRMIRKHGSGRILFGSDAPWQDPGLVLKALRALPLDPSDLRRIEFENAAELFGI